MTEQDRVRVSVHRFLVKRKENKKLALSHEAACRPKGNQSWVSHRTVWSDSWAKIVRWVSVFPQKILGFKCERPRGFTDHADSSYFKKVLFLPFVRILAVPSYVYFISLFPTFLNISITSNDFHILGVVKVSTAAILPSWNCNNW